MGCNYSKPKNTFILFMRHGERADSARLAEYSCLDDEIPYDSDIAHDPPLTSQGLKQAAHAGAYLAGRLKDVEEEFGIEFDEVIIESSPFLRCLQTSSKAAEAL